MATEPESEYPAEARPMRCSDERWERMWTQREHLLRVARRRSVSAEDAEDAVHEAMLRAMEHPHLDDTRIGAWLTTVTIRLCVDRHRQVNREVEVGSRTTLAVPAPPPIEEEVCDRAEATWLAVRSGDLPARQAEALWLKSNDLDVDQVARKMGLSYRTVESLLARARRTLRNSLAGTLALGLWLVFGRGGRHGAAGGTVQSAGAVSAAATLAVLGLAMPGVYDATGPHTTQAVPERALESPAEEDGGRPHRTGTPGPGAGIPRGPDAGGLGVRLPGAWLPLLAGVPTLDISSASVPPVPRVAGLPGLPDLPLLPGPSVRTGLPSLPGVPEVSETPLPDGSVAPDVPGAPEVPDVPGVPVPSSPASPGTRLPVDPGAPLGNGGGGSGDEPVPGLPQPDDLDPGISPE